MYPLLRKRILHERSSSALYDHCVGKVHCRRRRRVSTILESMCQGKGIKPQYKLESSLRRHLTLTLRTDETSIEYYFDTLEETLRSNKIFQHICDESGFSKAPKVVCIKGSKTVSHLTGNDKSQITTCCNLPIESKYERSQGSSGKLSLKCKRLILSTQINNRTN